MTNPIVQEITRVTHWVLTTVYGSKSVNEPFDDTYNEFRDRFIDLLDEGEVQLFSLTGFPVVMADTPTGIQLRLRALEHNAYTQAANLVAKLPPSPLRDRLAKIAHHNPIHWRKMVNPVASPLKMASQGYAFISKRPNSLGGFRVDPMPFDGATLRLRPWRTISAQQSTSLAA